LKIQTGGRDATATLKMHCKRFLKIKIGITAFYVLTMILFLAYSYINLERTILPRAELCGEEPLFFDGARNIEWRCHFSYEWEIFLLTIVGDCLKILLAITFFISIVNFKLNYVDGLDAKIERSKYLVRDTPTIQI